MKLWPFILLALVAFVESNRLECIKAKFAIEGVDIASAKKEEIMEKLITRGRRTTIINVNTPKCVSHGERWVGTEAEICSTDSELNIEDIDKVEVFRLGISVSDAFVKIYGLCKEHVTHGLNKTI